MLLPILWSLWPIPQGWGCSPLTHLLLFSLQVLVVWDESSNKVRNYRIFEKVGPAPGPWLEGHPSLGLE